MPSAPEVSVTLASELYELLREESHKLDVSIEWLVASLVVDTFEGDGPGASIL